MTKIRQILRLYPKEIGKKKIANRVGSSKNTVRAYIGDFIKLRLSIEDALKLSDLELNNLFHPPRIENPSFPNPLNNRQRMTIPISLHIFEIQNFTAIQIQAILNLV